MKVELWPISRPLPYAKNPHKIPDSVVRIMRHKARGIEVSHPAVFPVALVKEMAEVYTKSGDTIFEPFSGSGTAIVSCEMMDIACHAIELAPEYVDVSILRWQKFTGQEAILESTGKTYEETKDVRYDGGKDSKEGYEAFI